MADGDAVGVLEKVALTWRLPRRRRGFWFGLAIEVFWPVVMLSEVRWRGREHIPRTGAVLVATNHLSDADPVVTTAFLLARGRLPRFLAKAELWRMPVVGRVMTAGGHIPVERDRSGGDAYRHALAAVRRGECLAVYPEAKLTSDPAGWPMRGKSGLARIALTTGAPVVPVAHWGVQGVLPPGARRLRLRRRPRLWVAAGPPVDLSDLVVPGGAASLEALDVATRRVMAAITALLAEVRGEPAPVLLPRPAPAVHSDAEPPPHADTA